MSTFHKRFWPYFFDYALLLIGATIQAIGLRLFLVPANLASGGVTGISQLINHFTGWPIGLMVLAGNFPLFLLGWRFLGGRQFALRTAFAVIVYSLIVDLLPRLRVLPTNGITDDIFLMRFTVLSSAAWGMDWSIVQAERAADQTS
jgi:uncharacterized membrane-anchored protein YitT (DUF2179 family)